MIRVIELGPFGCTLDHGTVQSLDEISEGYTVKSIVSSPESQVAIIEPCGQPGITHTPGQTRK